MQDIADKEREDELAAQVRENEKVAQRLQDLENILVADEMVENEMKKNPQKKFTVMLSDICS